MVKRFLKFLVPLVLLPATADCAGVLSLSFSTNVISEAQVARATVATVTTDSILTNALRVGIFSDATQITVPTSVTIPAGTNAVAFSVGAVNNGIIDGTRTTTVTVSADTWTSANNTLTITDDDTPAHRTIGGNLVGELATNIYWVMAPLLINKNQTLTIDPGCTLLFASGTGIANGGTLLAAGSDGAKILFTSAAASPTNGSWNGLIFTNYNTPQSILNQVEIAYATSGVGVVPAGDSTSLLLLTNSAIHNCSAYGVYVTANSAISIGSSAVQILGNQIYGNGNHGVFLIANVFGCDSGSVRDRAKINSVFMAQRFWSLARRE